MDWGELRPKNSSEQKTKDKNMNKLIYHYTSLGSLKSIIESETLWATNIRFLNDTEEYTHALKIFNNSIEKIQGRDSPEIALPIKDLVNQAKSLNFDSQQDHFAISFAKNGDQLSQWRAYGNVCIAFNKEKLEKSLKKELRDVYIKDCKYDEEEITENLSKKATLLISELIKTKKTHEDRDLNLDFFSDFYTDAAFFKHSGFKEEGEYRFVYQTAQIEKIKFREKNNCFIPYIPISFDIESIEKIIIGPCPHPDRTQNSLNYFIDCIKKPCRITTEISLIPYINS